MKDEMEIPRFGMMLPPIKEAITGYMGCQMEGPEQGAETKLHLQKALYAGLTKLKEILVWLGARDLGDFEQRFAGHEPNWDGVDAARAYRTAILVQKGVEIMIDLGLDLTLWDKVDGVLLEAEADLRAAGVLDEILELGEVCRCISCRTLRGDSLDVLEGDAPDF